MIKFFHNDPHNENQCASVRTAPDEGLEDRAHLGPAGHRWGGPQQASLLLCVPACKLEDSNHKTGI